MLRERRVSGAVAAESARRFAERARARRRMALRPFLVGAAVLAVVGALLWVLLGSPWLVVRQVSVTGTDRLDPDAARAVVADEVGTPLARVDLHEVEDELVALPLVRSAEVVRAWPSTLEVRVTERVPVAAVRAGAGYDVLDRTGRTVLTTSRAPSEVPVIEVDRSRAAPGTVAAVTKVLDDLPEDLRERIATAGGTTRDSVVLTLRGGARVVWGSAERSALKAEVLGVLLERPADVYDVSSPTTPVTRQD